MQVGKTKSYTLCGQCRYLVNNGGVKSEVTQCHPVDGRVTTTGTIPKHLQVISSEQRLILESATHILKPKTSVCCYMRDLPPPVFLGSCTAWRRSQAAFSNSPFPVTRSETVSLSVQLPSFSARVGPAATPPPEGHKKMTVKLHQSSF